MRACVCVCASYEIGMKPWGIIMCSQHTWSLITLRPSLFLLYSSEANIWQSVWLDITGGEVGFNRQSSVVHRHRAPCSVVCRYIWQQQRAPLCPILRPHFQIEGLGEKHRKRKKHFERGLKSGRKDGKTYPWESSWLTNNLKLLVSSG